MQDLTQGSINRHLVQMSLFIGASILVQTLYFLVDLYFVAQLGDAALAGVNAAGNVMFITLALTQVLAVGTVTLIAHAVGRKDSATANRVFNQSFILGVAFAVLVAVAGYAVTGEYMDAIAADAAVASAGREYLHWYLPGLAAQFLMVAMSSALRGTGIVKPTMTVQAATVVLNIILAPVLIAGWGTGKPLGAMGAGLASSISIAAGVVLLTVYFIKLEKYVAFDRSLWRARLDTWKDLLRIGLPAGGEFALLFLVSATIYWCARDFGSEAQAGIAVGLRVMQSIFLPAMAVSFAATPVAGQNFGAQRADRVRQTFRSAALMSVAFMAVLTLVCQLSPETLVRPFTSEREVIAVATRFLRILSWNFVGNGLIFTCSALFQALGNTWPALVSSAARILTFVVPAIWLSMQPWMRLEHLWYLSVTTIALQAVFSLALLRRELRLRLEFGQKAVASAPAPATG
jgi:putative MATE family efflux protein